jgi:hypothetical protein
METNWEERYRGLKTTFADPPRAWLTSHSFVLPEHGWVLETAFGLGSNVAFLSQHGNRWVGIERSIEAVRFVKKHHPDTRIIRADLSCYPLPKITFDLICNFYFYEESLYQQFIPHLLPGGYLVLETLTKKMLEKMPEINPDRLISPGSLKTYFQRWDILDYREGWIQSEHGGEKAVESIVVRKKE